MNSLSKHTKPFSAPFHPILSASIIYISFTFSYPTSHVQVLLILQGLSQSPALHRPSQTPNGNKSYLFWATTAYILCYVISYFVVHLYLPHRRASSLEQRLLLFSICSVLGIISGTWLIFNKWLGKKALSVKSFNQ